MSFTIGTGNAHAHGPGHVIETMGLFSRRAKVAYRTTRTKVAAVVGDLAENLAGIRVIQAFAQEANTQKKFDQVNRDNRDAHVQAMSLAFMFLPTVEFLGILAMAIVLWFGGYWVTRGEVSIGTAEAAHLHRQSNPGRSANYHPR